MHFSIDGDDLIKAAGNPAAKRIIQSAAYFLLAAIGDIPDETEVPVTALTLAGAPNGELVVPTGTSGNPSAPSVAQAAMATAANSAGVSGAGNTTPTLPTSTMAPQTLAGVSNVLPFPPPPPPPPVADMRFGSNPDYVPPPHPMTESEGDDETGEPNTGNVPPPPPLSAGTAAAPPILPVGNAGGVVTVVSAEVDSVGMPYDARIHQKSKNTKKNGEWKLIKGIEEKSPGLVQSVTAELAARRGSLPPASTFAGSNTVPLPPVPNATAANGVPAPNGVGAPVPVPPPPPAVGVVGSASPYRALIDKITDLTKAQKLAPSKVAEICQVHGAPSLMALNNMQQVKSMRYPELTIIEGVDKDIDAAALGLM